MIQVEERLEHSSPDFVVCTIAAKNYLAHVRVLADSCLTHHPGSKIVVLLADEVSGYFQPDEEKFDLVHLEELGIERLDAFRFKYSTLELSTAVKPFFLEHLLKQHRKVVYLDPDILVTNTLLDLSKLLERYSIILTPHLLEPIDDDRRPNELDVLLAGVYNLGFIAIAGTETAILFLKWWQRRVYDNCVKEPLKGLFVDQKWLELALGFFDGILILRDQGYNVAFWNMGQRALTLVDGKYFISDRPLRFFHFSGYDPDNMNQISKHQDRFTLKDMPRYLALFENYRKLLDSKGYQAVKQWPWAYDCFDNGIRIPEPARAIYRESIKLQDKFPDPFLTRGQESYFAWLNASAESVPGKPYITRLWHRIYTLSKDLRKVYPDVFASDRRGFIEWVVSTGMREYNIDKSFIPVEYFSTSDFSEGSMGASGVGGLKACGKALRELASIGRRSLRVIRYEGLGSFLRQTADKIRNMDFKIVELTSDRVEPYFHRLSDLEFAQVTIGGRPATRPE
jgi:hypothetical protein